MPWATGQSTEWLLLVELEYQKLLQLSGGDVFPETRQLLPQTGAVVEPLAGHL